jgi:hypothetical protein
MAGFDTAFDDLPAVKPMATDGLFDDLPEAPQAKPLGTLDYLTRKLTQVGGKMMQGASIAGGGLAGAVGMDDLRDQAFDLSTNYGKFGKDAEIGVGTNDAAQSMPQRIAGAGVQAIPALAAFVANPALGLGLVSSLSMADSGDLISGGVDAGTAGKVFATDVAGNAVGMLPFVGPALGPIGNTLARRVISGAAANAFQGGATDAAKQSILSGNGYEEQAQQYDPLNPEARIVDLLLGGGTGVHAHYSPEARQQRQGQQEAVARQGRIDSLLAAQEAKVAADTQAAAHAVDLQTYGPILEANGIDPNSPRAQGVIANLKAREALKEQAQAEAKAETVPPSPEEIALAQRQQTPAVIPVDSTGRADAGEQTFGVKASMLDQGGDAALIDSQARFQREQRGADPIEQPTPLDSGRVEGDVLPPDSGTSVVPTGRGDGDTINSRPMPGEGRPLSTQQPDTESPAMDRETSILDGKRAVYQAIKNSGAPDDVTASLVVKYQEQANSRGESMTLWESENGQLGLVPSANKSPFVNGKRVGTLYPESNKPENLQQLSPRPDPARLQEPQQRAPQAEQPAADTKPLPRGENAPQAPAPKSEPTPAKPVASEKPKVSESQFSSLEKELAAKTHEKESYGDVGVVVGGGKVRYVSMADAVESVKKAVANGTNPVAFQIHNSTGIRIGDVQRVLDSQKGASLGQEKTSQEVLTKTDPKEADPTAGIPKGMFTKVKDVEYDAGSGKKVGTAKEAMRDLNRSLSDYQAFLDCLRG